MGQGIYCSTLLLLGIFAQILLHVQSKCRSVNCVYYDRISLNLSIYLVITLVTAKSRI